MGWVWYLIAIGFPVLLVLVTGLVNSWLGAPSPDLSAVVWTDVALMLEKTGARGHRLFGGRLDRRQLGLAEKAMVRMVGAVDGDYRPWGDIEAWAEEIADTLKARALTRQPA